MRIGAFVIVGTVFMAGCGGAKNAGQKMGETVTDFASGVGKGIDKRLKVSVELSESLKNLGVRNTVSKSTSLDHGKQKGIAVYLIASKPVNLSLTAKAQNDEGDEIGRAKSTATFAADDAKYVTFTFDPEMDTQLVHQYIIDGREAPENEAAAPAEAPDSEETDHQN